MAERLFFNATTIKVKEFSLSKKDGRDEVLLLENFQDIQLNYSILKGCLRDLFNNKAIEKTHLNDLVVLLIDHARTLKKIQLHYLSSPHKAADYDKEIALYRNFLKDNGVDDVLCSSPSRSAALSDTIRTITAQTNWPRLFIVRVKRVFDISALLAHNARAFRHFTELFNSIAAPIFAWLAWVFYLPRLVTNLMIMARHVIPNPWMDQQERDMEWTLRFKLQLQQLWFELANDLVWAAVGLVNCFILVGHLTPAAAYLTVVLYSYDVMLALIRSYVERKAFKAYETMLQDDDSLAEPIKKEMLLKLKEKYQYERRRLGISIATTAGLFAAMGLTIPAFAAITPIIPLVGVSLVLAICMISYGLGNYFEKYKLNDNLPDEFVAQNCPQEEPGLKI